MGLNYAKSCSIHCAGNIGPDILFAFKILYVKYALFTIVQLTQFLTVEDKTVACFFYIIFILFSEFLEIGSLTLHFHDFCEMKQFNCNLHFFM